MTIKELYFACFNEIKNGNGDKNIYISRDDEGNGYHHLFYEFTPIEQVVDGTWISDDFLWKNQGHTKENSIILG